MVGSAKQWKPNYLFADAVLINRNGNSVKLSLDSKSDCYQWLPTACSLSLGKPDPLFESEIIKTQRTLTRF